ncbi:MAG TPA: hypothetical protein VK254_03825 [Candidatus Bathyarchaeia archaeon]|nr:hypothetical protein [Candidatus Bathyarchaeia archaeon]
MIVQEWQRNFVLKEIAPIGQYASKKFHRELILKKFGVAWSKGRWHFMGSSAFTIMPS